MISCATSTRPAAAETIRRFARSPTLGRRESARPTGAPVVWAQSGKRASVPAPRRHGYAARRSLYLPANCTGARRARARAPALGVAAPNCARRPRQAARANLLSARPEGAATSGRPLASSLVWPFVILGAPAWPPLRPNQRSAALGRAQSGLGSRAPLARPDCNLSLWQSNGRRRVIVFSAQDDAPWWPATDAPGRPIATPKSDNNGTRGRPRSLILRPYCGLLAKLIRSGPLGRLALASRAGLNKIETNSRPAPPPPGRHVAPRPAAAPRGSHRRPPGRSFGEPEPASSCLGAHNNRLSDPGRVQCQKLARTGR